MNAAPLLTRIAKTFSQHRHEVILIGNAAAALHGAPVTTINLDSMFQPTARNIKKLKSIAIDLGAVIMRPYYPVSDLYRIFRDSDCLQLEMMPRINGVRTYLSLRSRATSAKFGAFSTLGASLEDIVKSKKAARKGKDLAVIDILEPVLVEKQKTDKKK